MANTPPNYLTDTQKTIWREVKASCKPNAPLAIVEMIALQLFTARECREKLDKDGHIVADSRGNPVPHPAIALERAAQKSAANMLRQHAKR